MLTVLITIIYMISGPGPDYSSEVTGKVVSVVDGNTFEIITEEKETIQIMLKDVDCPEIGQPFGDMAKQFAEMLTLKRKVKVQFRGKDRWGNKLAILLLQNGRNINLELVKNGLAWAAVKADESIVELESLAKQQKSGLWSENEPEAPWIYRRKLTMQTAKTL